jgi:tetrahydromethanopterin S-methyltransferase subunit B
MRHRAHPQQAGFFRRFFAFAVDTLIVTLVSLVVFFSYNEIAARLNGRTGEFSRFMMAMKERASASILIRGTSMGLTIGKPREAEGEFKSAFLKKLRESLPEQEFARASELSLGEMEKEYPQIMNAFPGGRGKVYILGGEALSVIYEFVCGYAYFILFFRFGGRTPGKRLFGLKVIDLEGRPRLGWYQAFERTHGYAASTLAAFLGFLQVIWDHGGQTMHDRIAGTTVVRWKRSA